MGQKDETQMRQRHRVGKRQPKAGEGGSRRDTGTGVRAGQTRAGKIKRRSEDGKKLGEGEGGKCPWGGEADPGAAREGYWHMGVGWDRAGMEPRGATTLPEGTGEGGAVSGLHSRIRGWARQRVARHGPIMVRKVFSYQSKETRLKQAH